MAEPRQYDVIVIGAGPAGVNAAVTAAMLGKSVVVIEKNQVVGGAGTNTGTLPSKTLRETALALSGLKTRKLYGVDLSLRREATDGQTCGAIGNSWVISTNPDTVDSRRCSLFGCAYPGD